MTMGELIRYHRKELNLSQEDLGRILNPPVNKAAINKWENGTVENIKRTHIQQMSKLFNIPPHELMAFDFDNRVDVATSSRQSELIELFRNMNKEGQQEVIKYAIYIASQDKYRNVKKESSPVRGIS